MHHTYSVLTYATHSHQFFFYVQAARAVAERALKRIQFRQEEERLNIWVGLMNLELKYGSRDELAQVVERACSAAHPKRIHLRLAEVRQYLAHMCCLPSLGTRLMTR